VSVCRGTEGYALDDLEAPLLAAGGGAAPGAEAVAAMALLDAGAVTGTACGQEECVCVSHEGWGERNHWMWRSRFVRACITQRSEALPHAHPTHTLTDYSHNSTRLISFALHAQSQGRPQGLTTVEREKSSMWQELSVPVLQLQSRVLGRCGGAHSSKFASLTTKRTERAAQEQPFCAALCRWRLG
jgi:hypothetical protein